MASSYKVDSMAPMAPMAHLDFTSSAHVDPTAATSLGDSLLGVASARRLSAEGKHNVHAVIHYCMLCIGVCTMVTGKPAHVDIHIHAHTDFFYR